MMKKLLDKLKSNGILKSSFGLLAVTMLVKIFGYVEKQVLAKYVGTSDEADVYIVVITLILSLFFFFREIVEPGFLNVFLDSKSKGNEKVSWELFNKGLRLIFFITAAISIVSIVFPDIVVNIFAPGFNGEKFALSKQIVRIAIPACIFLALSTLTSITLNGLKIFVLPASGELVFKGVIILSLVFCYKEYGLLGAGVGIIVGSIGRLAVHLIKLYKNVSFKKITIEKKYTKRVWLLTWPLLIGVSFSQVSGLVDNIFASYLQEGAIAALSYAKKVVELPVIIFPYVLSVVVFPYFSQLSVEKEKNKLEKLLSDSLRWIVIGFIPISVFFFFYSNTIVEIIFERGAFDANSTILTAKPLLIYSLGLVFFAIETIVVVFYYATADTKTPTFIGIGCVILNILLTWIFIKYTSMGYKGIALAYVIQKTIKNIILLYLVKNKISYNGKKVMAFIAKILLSSLVFTICIAFTKQLFFRDFDHNLLYKLGFMGGCFVVAGGIYLLILHVFKTLNINGEQKFLK